VHFIYLLPAAAAENMKKVKQNPGNKRIEIMTKNSVNGKSCPKTGTKSS
jgi:hypothetical protein